MEVIPSLLTWLLPLLFLTKLEFVIARAESCTCTSMEASVRGPCADDSSSLPCPSTLTASHPTTRFSLQRTSTSHSVIP